VAVLAPVLLASAAACGDDDTSAGPEAGVTVDEIQEPQYFHEGEYLGQTVRISAAVSAVPSPRHIEVAGTDYGEDSLLVVTQEPVDVKVGDVLRITGIVGQPLDPTVDRQEQTRRCAPGRGICTA